MLHGYRESLLQFEHIPHLTHGERRDVFDTLQRQSDLVYAVALYDTTCGSTLLADIRLCWPDGAS